MLALLPAIVAGFAGGLAFASLAHDARRLPSIIRQLAKEIDHASH
jgi:hypothetical protein